MASIARGLDCKWRKSITGRRRLLELASRPAAALLAALFLAGCAADVPGPRHVFLITVDTLRADHLGLYGYPRATSEHLEELASGGLVFDRAIAQWPATGSSFASIFTGRYPQTTGLTQGAAVTLPDDYLTLAELMSERGFVTAAVVSNGMLSRAAGWSQGFDEYLQTWDLAPEPTDDPIVYRQWINARRVNELALPLLDRLREADRVFVWLHYSDPHAPYFLPAGVDNPFLGDPWDVGDAPVKIGRRVRAKALGENRDLSYYVAHYDANVRLADEHIGEALGRARELGLLDDALVVFTSDHGESLGEHDYYFGHGRLPYNASAHVPLVMVDTRAGASRRVAAPVELIDLYPTVRSLVAGDLEAPAVEGDSLASLLGEDTQAPPDSGFAFSQAGGGSGRSQFRSVQDERWKLILRPGRPAHRSRGPRPERWELYRLDQDPMESRDLLEEEAGEFRRLRHELERWVRSDERLPRTEETEAQSEEATKALKALGYVD